MNPEYQKIIDGVNMLTSTAHENSVKAGWYTDLKTGLPKERNIGEMLNLIHSEISEATEGERKGSMDDHLPHRKMIECELADALIRIGDLAGHLKLDLGNAIVEKMEYNKVRLDHKIENRIKDGGKKF